MASPNSITLFDQKLIIINLISNASHIIMFVALNVQWKLYPFGILAALKYADVVRPHVALQTALRNRWSLVVWHFTDALQYIHIYTANATKSQSTNC